MPDDYSPLRDRFIRASLAIAHASSFQNRQLQATAAASRRREQQKRDARISLQKGGTMYIQDGRDAVVQKDNEKLDLARKKYERLQTIADNKAKREQKALEVAARKRQREAVKQAKLDASQTARNARSQ
ncbi:hypothetical protein Vi05172_g12057 [Venturia inaequalis]|nr:hypothetical protein Vi05172_g12057 [Venturia inaequalis]